MKKITMLLCTLLLVGFVLVLPGAASSTCSCAQDQTACTEYCQQTMDCAFGIAHCNTSNPCDYTCACHGPCYY